MKLYEYYKKNGVNGLFVTPKLSAINQLPPIRRDELDEILLYASNIDIAYVVKENGELITIKIDLTKLPPKAYILNMIQSEFPVLIFINSRCSAYIYCRKLEKDRPAEKREYALKLRKRLETTGYSF